MADYSYWKDALAGKNPPIINEQPELGFYRMKRGKRWIPVAVWPTGEALNFKIGKEVVEPVFGIELWPFYASYPITEETYRKVAEDGLDWPSSDPIVSSFSETNLESTLELKTAIFQAKEGAAVYSKIESDEESVKAAGLRNLLLKLRKEADTIRVKEKAPHLEAAKSVDREWMFLIKEAQDASDKIRSAMEAWEDTKRESTTINNAFSNLPPPSQKIIPINGRAASVTTKLVVTSIDVDVVFHHFKDRHEVIELLTKLAQVEINAGNNIPGVVMGKRSKIR